MGEDEIRELQKKLQERFPNITNTLMSVAIMTHGEIVKWHETDVQLTGTGFSAAKSNPDLLRKLVIFLLASDMAQGEKVPILCHFWLVPELGGKRGWVRMKLRLPKKSIFPNS
jgi:hypothetical protein